MISSCRATDMACGDKESSLRDAVIAKLLSVTQLMSCICLTLTNKTESRDGSW